MPELWISALLIVAIVYCIVRIRFLVNRLNAQTHENTLLRGDITDLQRRAEISTNQLHAITNYTFTPQLILDSERRIVMLNPAAQELFDLQGRGPGMSLISVVRDYELDSVVRSILGGENIFETQIELNHHSFRVRGALVKGVSQTSTGALKLGIVLTLMDITELLRLTRARREMVANFSHDLRTPISSIRLLVDTLMVNMGRNAERDQRLLNKIASETDSLQHMTQELIDLSMIESGQAIIRMVPVNFAQVLGEALNRMATQVEQKKLELVNNVPADLPVLVDPDQTRRVIMNIIHNAVKFTPVNKKIHFDAETSDSMVTVHITDDGPGIPPQDRDRIFERFYQVEPARTHGVSGSGLGLSIAKHIIEAQGGKIWAEAGNPGGACITFTLPRAEEVVSKEPSA